jgi:F-type H+-transporting ATPase subunit delta
MKISNRQLAKDLYHILKEVNQKDHGQVLKNFIDVLIKLRKMSQANRIIEEYVAYEKEMNGEVRLEVTTQHTLSDEIKKILVKQFGGKVDLKETVDTKILGGIIVKSKNTIYDASVRGTLHQLKNSL